MHLQTYKGCKKKVLSQVKVVFASDHLDVRNNLASQVQLMIDEHEIAQHPGLPDGSAIHPRQNVFLLQFIASFCHAGNVVGIHCSRRSQELVSFDLNMLMCWLLRMKMASGALISTRGEGATVTLCTLTRTFRYPKGTEGHGLCWSEGPAEQFVGCLVLRKWTCWPRGSPEACG